MKSIHCIKVHMTAGCLDTDLSKKEPYESTFQQTSKIDQQISNLEAVALAHHITSQSTSHHITSRITLHHITSPHHIATTHHITSYQPSHHLHITSHHPSHHLHITSHIKSGIQKEVLKQKRIVSRKQ